MGVSIPRRRIEEFAALYEFEPEVIDFFVEGRSDRVLIEHVLEGTGARVRVWEAGDVDIPSSLVAEIDESIGARGRIIALSHELEKLLHDEEREYPVLCITDADFDHILQPTVPSSRFLVKTDFSCIESYYWNLKVLRKYLKLSLHETVPFTAEDLMTRVESAMREIYLMRLAAASLALNFSWIDPASCCGDARKGGDFDREIYLTKLLNKNSAAPMKRKIEESIDRFRTNLPEDARHLVHGHDLCKLISWLIKPHMRDRNLIAEEVISRSLACCIESADLIKYPLFARIGKFATIS
ncbi:hypothetical protein [Streptomyces phaeochromogenes]|uniref:hypothetical protein n=1 Tax=Streptomyces phaeochromogenes TaxID=1923 RepID=UPI0038636BC7|nr:DUF4435 domain-containing protein [Streptomyces phaeochromogenes]